jgi:hypothetical protein
LTTTDDLAWQSTAALIKTARRFRTAFWWFFCLTLLGLVITISLVVNGGATADVQKVAAAAGLQVATQSLSVTTGSLLLGWLITALLARHAEVIYFSGPNSTPRNRKELGESSDEAQKDEMEAYVQASTRAREVSATDSEKSAVVAKKPAQKGKYIEMDNNQRCPNCGGTTVIKDDPKGQGVEKMYCWDCLHENA